MPLAIDLFCGLGGWTEGLLAEGFDVIGFDIEAHEYDGEKYPAQLVLQDVLTLHGRQFKDADLIVASPPCQEYSYMAMPWTRAKRIRAALLGEWFDHGDGRRSFGFPSDYCGSRTIDELNALFKVCFRIQREAIEAAGRFIPLVVENVRGAQEWVGRSRWNFGSFHLWGDVPALMPIGAKFKSKGMNCSDPTLRGQDFTRIAGRQNLDGIKQGGDWFNQSAPSISRMSSSKSKARKAASARIAKIPFVLSSYIARTYYPDVRRAMA